MANTNITQAAPVSYAPPLPGTTRAMVHVLFLYMNTPPVEPAPAMPQGASIIRLPAPSTGFYRWLQRVIGQHHLWWLRPSLTDTALAAELQDPLISIHVLYIACEPAGFFEIDRRDPSRTNIAYFGLMPWMMGQGLGRVLLRAAIDEAWAGGATVVTVNTSSADHPHACRNYIARGFVPFHLAEQAWDIPDTLGMAIPHAARVAVQTAAQAA